MVLKHRDKSWKELGEKKKKKRDWYNSNWTTEHIWPVVNKREQVFLPVMLENTLVISLQDIN